MMRHFAWRPLVALAAAALLVGCASTPDLVVRPLPPNSPRLAQADRKLADALRRAEASYGAALSGGSPAAEAAYEAAITEVIHELSLRSSSRAWDAPIDVANYQLRIPPGNRGRPYWTASRWSAVIPASAVRRIHARERVRADGFGCPVILFREHGDGMQRLYYAMPHNGIHIPATAVLKFGAKRAPGGPQPVELALINTRDFQRMRIAGREVSLAYDLTAPIELQFRNEFVQSLAWSGLRFPDQNRDRAGVFGVEPYDANKIPVVFVHGLNSDPHIWMDAMNAVLADPILRRRYQIWYFIYPTGLAVPSSARLLRDDLIATRHWYDPAGRDPGPNNVVLIGHSMGGLLSRMQIIDSGDEIRRAYLRESIDQLSISAANRERLRRALYFERLPWITEVAFLATPHRGSEIADWRLVRFFLRFIRLTGETAGLVGDILTFNEDAINPELRNFNALGARSVETLSPQHPYFRALEALPMQAPYHSIIGDRGRGDTPNSSDGIVPYRSSHLAGAESEVIVPARHSLTTHPETVSEVRRILLEHLQRRGKFPRQEVRLRPSKKAGNAKRAAGLN